MLDIGITSLRLAVEKTPENRARAIAAVRHHSALPGSVAAAHARDCRRARQADSKMCVARSQGAKPEWVKPIAKEEGSGSSLSFRGIFGTSRNKRKATPMKTFTSTPVQGSIPEE